MTVRVGQGVDVHRYGADVRRPLVLGGVRIPGEPGLEGHSDADVLLHALVDALLGAAGLGDIGMLFGSDEPRFAGADSRIFLADAVERIAAQGWAIGNADVTLIGQRPRIGPYRDHLVMSVAALLGIEEARVNVKATTTDRLGFTGRGEGLACLAVVLLEA